MVAFLNRKGWVGECLIKDILQFFNIHIKLTFNINEKGKQLQKHSALNAIFMYDICNVIRE